MSEPIMPVRFTYDFVDADSLIPFRVVLDTSYEYQHHTAEGTETVRDSVVEFYDLRYPHTENGQFTGARYCFPDMFRKYPGAPLILDGDVKEWRVSGPDMTRIRQWLAGIYGMIATA